MVCTVIRDRLWALDFSCMFTDEGYVTINYHTLKSHDLRGVILSLPLSPLVILQDSPLAVHQCPFSTQECTPGWKIALRERRFFSNQHNKIIQPVLVCVPMGPVVRMLAITHLVIFLP